MRKKYFLTTKSCSNSFETTIFEKKKKKKKKEKKKKTYHDAANIYLTVCYIKLEVEEIKHLFSAKKYFDVAKNCHEHVFALI